MHNVTELSKRNGKVYVYLKNETITQQFLQDAENEGFTFGDGARPTTRASSDLYAVNPDHTINYVGWAGHMAYQAAKKIGDQELIRVDYAGYLASED